MFKYIIFILFISFAFADNEVYQYTDKNGNIVVGNKKTTNSTQMNLPNLTVMPITQMKEHKRFSNSELKRRQILQEELIRETEMLNQSKQMVKNSDQLKLDKKQIDVLNDSVNAHQQNINILNKQLGN